MVVDKKKRSSLQKEKKSALRFKVWPAKEVEWASLRKKRRQRTAEFIAEHELLIEIRATFLAIAASRRFRISADIITIKLASPNMSL